MPQRYVASARCSTTIKYVFPYSSEWLHPPICSVAKAAIPRSVRDFREIVLGAILRKPYLKGIIHYTVLLGCLLRSTYADDSFLAKVAKRTKRNRVRQGLSQG